MSEIAIRVENLSKVYRIGSRQSGYKTLRESIVNAASSPFRRLSSVFGLRSSVGGSASSVPGPRSSVASNETIWALKDVSFEVKRGEVVGIIGRNGAGKSTLLKILSRITEPTEGQADIYGRVGSLLEVGTGFHPELTGRENIFLNGAILGMRKAEIEQKFDEIVSFAEIEKFIDTPVKHYSSGMYVRLAFAVAAHLEPEILLVDEVLAVGDAVFQKKCLGKMEDVAKGGRTVLFVSHNMAAIEALCPRGFLIDAGRIIRNGRTGPVIDEYLQKILPAITSNSLSVRKDRSGTGAVRLTGFHVKDCEGNISPALRSGKDAIFSFDFETFDENQLGTVDIGFGLYSMTGQLLFVLYASYVGQEFKSIPFRGTFFCKIPQFPLAPGRYRVGARVTVGGEESDWPQDGIGYVDVEAGDFYGTGKKGFSGDCPLLVSGNWSVQGF
jgi:lipopolysaccharide transport system ATP-binding protein